VTRTFIDLPGEEWRVVPGHNDMYEASNLGRVRSYGSKSGRRAVPRLLSRRVSGGGYLQVSLNGVGHARNHFVHRLVLEAFVGPCPRGLQARHLNGDCTDNSPSNLAWGTTAENVEDSIRHGTKPRGSAHANAKLTEDDVREIRRRVAMGTSHSELAKAWHVSKATICSIAARRSWPHV
jgi:HNH endonuclease/NUMOD4 motif-containing protein